MVLFGGERGTLQARARLAKKYSQYSEPFPNAPIYPETIFHPIERRTKRTPLFYEACMFKRCAVRAVEAVLYGMVMR